MYVDEREVVGDAEDVGSWRIAGDRLQFPLLHVLRDSDHQQGDAVPTCLRRGPQRRWLVHRRGVQEDHGQVAVARSVSVGRGEDESSQDVERGRRVAWPASDQQGRINR